MDGIMGDEEVVASEVDDIISITCSDNDLDCEELEDTLRDEFRQIKQEKIDDYPDYSKVVTTTLHKSSCPTTLIPPATIHDSTHPTVPKPPITIHNGSHPTTLIPPATIHDSTHPTAPNPPVTAPIGKDTLQGPAEEEHADHNEVTNSGPKKLINRNGFGDKTARNFDGSSGKDDGRIRKKGGSTGRGRRTCTSQERTRTKMALSRDSNPAVGRGRSLAERYRKRLKTNFPFSDGRAAIAAQDLEAKNMWDRMQLIQDQNCQLTNLVEKIYLQLNYKSNFEQALLHKLQNQALAQGPGTASSDNLPWDLSGCSRRVLCGNEGLQGPTFRREREEVIVPDQRGVAEEEWRAHVDTFCQETRECDRDWDNPPTRDVPYHTVQNIPCTVQSLPVRFLLEDRISRHVLQRNSPAVPQQPRPSPRNNLGDMIPVVEHLPLGERIGYPQGERWSHHYYPPLPETDAYGANDRRAGRCIDEGWDDDERRIMHEAEAGGPWVIGERPRHVPGGSGTRVVHHRETMGEPEVEDSWFGMRCAADEIPGRVGNRRWMVRDRGGSPCNFGGLHRRDVRNVMMMEDTMDAFGYQEEESYDEEEYWQEDGLVDDGIFRHDHPWSYELGGRQLLHHPVNTRTF